MVAKDANDAPADLAVCVLCCNGKSKGSPGILGRGLCGVENSAEQSVCVVV